MAALEGRAFVASAIPTPELAKSPEEVDDEQEGKALWLNIFVVNPVWEWDFMHVALLLFLRYFQCFSYEPRSSVSDSPPGSSLSLLINDSPYLKSVKLKCVKRT